MVHSSTGFNKIEEEISRVTTYQNLVTTIKPVQPIGHTKFSKRLRKRCQKSKNDGKRARRDGRL